MPFDITVLETRIRKLEEVRRMLSDPEIVQLLSEAFRAERNATATASTALSEDSASGNEEADLVIREVMQSTASEVSAAAADTYWSRVKQP